MSATLPRIIFVRNYVSYKTILRKECDRQPRRRHPFSRGASIAAVPPRKELRTNPKDYLAAGGTWPDDDLEEDAPPEAFILQEISKNFSGKVGPRGEAKVARDANVSRQAVRNILRGETWIDVPTLYRIEKGLGQKIWTRDY